MESSKRKRSSSSHEMNTQKNDTPYVVEKMFENVDVVLKMALLPHHTSQCMNVVTKQVNDMLYKYNESLGGVPVAYTDLRSPKGKEFARIFGEEAWLHVDVHTQMLVFTPRVGETIYGKVSKVNSVVNSCIINSDHLITNISPGVQLLVIA